MLIYTNFCYRSLKFCKDFCCMAIYHVTSLPWIFPLIVFKHLFIAPIQLVPSRWNFFMDSSPVKRPTTSKTSCRIFYISSDQNNTPKNDFSLLNEILLKAISGSPSLTLVLASINLSLTLLMNLYTELRFPSFWYQMSCRLNYCLNPGQLLLLLLF